MIRSLILFLLVFAEASRASSPLSIEDRRRARFEAITTGKFNECASSLARDPVEQFESLITEGLTSTTVDNYSISHPRILEGIEVVTEIFQNLAAGLTVLVTKPQIVQQDIGPEQIYHLITTQGEAEVLRNYPSPSISMVDDFYRRPFSLGPGTMGYSDSKFMRVDSLLERMEIVTDPSASILPQEYRSLRESVDRFKSYIASMNEFAIDQYISRRKWVDIVKKLPAIAVNTAERAIHIDIWQNDEDGLPIRRVAVFRLMIAPFGVIRVKDPQMKAFNKIRKQKENGIPPKHENGYTTFWGSFGNDFWNFYGFPKNRRSKIRLLDQFLPVEENFKGKFFLDRMPERLEKIRDERLLYELRILT
ncbi:MAG: hypothetical protein KDD25_02255, partial [Bdellovibrionales bacterium]|nr:hypothetical protein [Bdellovibrionales bacterium]